MAVLEPDNISQDLERTHHFHACASKPSKSCGAGRRQFVPWNCGGKQISSSSIRCGCLQQTSASDGRRRKAALLQSWTNRCSVISRNQAAYALQEVFSISICRTRTVSTTKIHDDIVGVGATPPTKEGCSNPPAVSDREKIFISRSLYHVDGAFFIGGVLPTRLPGTYSQRSANDTDYYSQRSSDEVDCYSQRSSNEVDCYSQRSSIQRY